METNLAFEAWLLSARKKNGDYYAESTQKSYLTAFCKAAERFHFLFNLSLADLDRINEIKTSDYYLDLHQNRRGELDAALELYEVFLHDREEGWQTIAEFSEGKQFATTNEFSLHVTYDKPFTVKELSEFLNGLDLAFKGMLIEQGCSRSGALQMDMTIAKVSEGSLWFEIFSAVAMVAIPIIELVVKRWLPKNDKKDCNCDVEKKE